MDKFTKNYIDDIVRPMIYRIQSLQKTNEQLKLQVKYLQSLIINNDKAYQKPTLSAANHMRESRLSSKGESSEKRPGWNSKTKIQTSPNVVNKQKQVLHHQKIKTKPPIPKIMKSPNKNQLCQDMRSSNIDKRAQISVKTQAANSQNKLSNEQSPQISPVKQQKTNPETKQSRQRESQGFNNKFEQLIKNNTEILSSMKQPTKTQTIKLPPNNYVQKVVAPKSQYNQSESASPHERSFASQAHPENKILKQFDGVKNIQAIQIK